MPERGPGFGGLIPHLGLWKPRKNEAANDPLKEPTFKSPSLCLGYMRSMHSLASSFNSSRVADT